MRAIESILKETAETTDGVQHYGRGPRSYANLDVNRYPRVWIHLVNPLDTVHQNGLITSEYEIVGEISGDVTYTGDVASHGPTTETYLETMEALQEIYYRYIANLNKHPLNKKAIGSVSRREILHEYDDNLAGYVFTIRLSIREAISYQCP